MKTVRQAAVADLFYPGNPTELKGIVESLLSGAKASPPQATKPPKALIAPHAGYVYSGKTAAEAYHLLQPHADFYQHVVLLGPSHRVGFSGIATCSADYYQTPLGDIPLDQALTAKALKCEGVHCFDQAHSQEHSLEVHIPFLQSVLTGFKLTPLVVGDSNATTTGHVIQQLWGNADTLFVISSDLSHFLTYDDAKAIDQKTCQAIERFDGAAISYEQACGRNPIKGLLNAAQQHPLQIETLDLCNSGDTAGDKMRVVGYGSWALWEA